MIEVLASGPLATVQDLGRPGLAELGVSRSGAADRAALRLANRLVGNAESAAGIEFTLGGLVVRLGSAATVACTGARCPVTGRATGRNADLSRNEALGWNVALSCPAGTLLAFGTPAAGLRSYLAVRGGVAAPAVLGSRATDTLSGLGPPPLAAGQRLPVGAATAGPPGTGGDLGDLSTSLAAGPAELRLAVGPRADWFEPGPLHATRWQVRPDSDRIGTRLAGSALRVLPGFERLAAELPSEPTLPGAVQVPPDGQPIVLGPDAPVTGGYPVVGVLAAADLDVLAQLRPGAVLRFVSLPTGLRYAAAGRPR